MPLRLLGGFLDLVYPRLCLACDRPVVEHPGTVCTPCQASLSPVPEPLCALCGRPLAREAERCDGCRDVRFHFARARGAVLYDGTASALIGACKYRGFGAAAAPLAGLVADVLRREGGADLLVPVPMHWRKRFSRGYNQAHLIASEAGRLTSVPVRDLLARRAALPSQVGLNRKQRLATPRGSVRVRRPSRVTGRVVVVVDDVITTGATVSDCCRALLEAGAAEAWAVAAARQP